MPYQSGLDLPRATRFGVLHPAVNLILFVRILPEHAIAGRSHRASLPQ